MTNARQGIAYDPSGRVLALVDGPELLVHDGETGAALWRETFGEELLGVAIAGDDLVVVGELGLVVQMTFLRRELHRMDLDATAQTFAVRPDGMVAVALERAIRILHKGMMRTLPRRDVSALAFSPDGATLLVSHGAKASKLEWVEVATLASLGEQSLALHVEALVADAGLFYVAQGEQLDCVTTPDAAVQPVISGLGFPLTDVLFHKATSTLALQCGRSIVDLYDAQTGKRTLRLQYPVRVARGLAFGPRPWLGIALSGGDADRIQLADRTVVRTPTHPGREHHTWIVSIDEGSGTPRIEGDGPRGFRGQPAPLALSDAQAKAFAEAALEMQRPSRMGGLLDRFSTQRMAVGLAFFAVLVLLRGCGLV